MLDSDKKKILEIFNSLEEIKKNSKFIICPGFDYFLYKEYPEQNPVKIKYCDINSVKYEKNRTTSNMEWGCSNSVMLDIRTNDGQSIFDVISSTGGVPKWSYFEEENILDNIYAAISEMSFPFRLKILKDQIINNGYLDYNSSILKKQIIYRNGDIQVIDIGIFKKEINLHDCFKYGKISLENNEILLSKAKYDKVNKYDLKIVLGENHDILIEIINNIGKGKYI